MLLPTPTESKSHPSTFVQLAERKTPSNEKIRRKMQSMSAALVYSRALPLCLVFLPPEVNNIESAIMDEMDFY